MTVRYIIAQILGAYVACLLVYVQYSDLIETAETALVAANALDAVQFTATGPGGIFALYAPHGAHLWKTFINEFITVRRTC
jgi:glycerol uptake facilitator-like aquaporin